MMLGIGAITDLEATEKLMPRAIQGTVPEVKHFLSRTRLTHGKPDNPDTLAGMVGKTKSNNTEKL